MKGARPLTEREVEAVYRAMGGPFATRNRALLLLGVRSGFRISELLSLRQRDVLQHQQVVQRVTVARRYMKKRVEGRTVYLHPAAASQLEAWLVELRRLPGFAGPRTYVFKSYGAQARQNRPISRVQAWRVLRRSFDACGLTGKLGTHCMRKTFADRVFEQLGRDLMRTQRAMGHRNVNSTVSYLSFKEEDIEAAIRSSSGGDE